MITETPRLRLRELTIDDADFVFELVNEPAFKANIGDKGIRTLDDARQFIRAGSWTNQEKPGYGQFLVERIEDAAPIGVCGLLYRESLDLTDVGFAILSPYRRRGYAFEAAAAVMCYGRSTLGVGRIVALTSEDNRASQGVLEKLGMSFDKTIKMSDDDPGTALYS